MVRDHIIFYRPCRPCHHFDEGIMYVTVFYWRAVSGWGELQATRVQPRFLSVLWSIDLKRCA